MDGKRLWAICVTAAWAACGASVGEAGAGGAVRVELRRIGERWQLFRAGRPYAVRGVGGDASRPLLKACGGNSVRTWGVDGRTRAMLDEAHRLGLTVTVGIWLGQRRQGFDYGDDRAVRRQLATARGVIERFRDHPAVLMWGIGNETELPPAGEPAKEDARHWKAVNDVAAAARELDPNHPTMTVIAEVGGEKVKSLHRYGSAIDVVGINSYAGAVSLPRRYRQAGGTKPYVVTEFGPPGTWEVAKNKLGVIDEPSSAAKAGWYRRAYEAFAADQALCLGSYAFLWGHKQEGTATWFGMFLPDGVTKTAAVDTMAELWSGKAPPNLSPTVASLTVDKADGLKPGETVRARLEVRDPEQDPIKVRWHLAMDSGDYATFGDRRGAPRSFREAVVRSTASAAEVKIPNSGGIYRLFALVYDGRGGGAAANVPLRVAGPVITLPPPPGREVKLPLVVVGDGGTSPYAPSGWMGNHKALSMDDHCRTQPHAGRTCVKFTYADSAQWAGVVWQDPPGDWGDRPGGYYLVGATRLTFWARGEKGGEQVKFGCGLIDRDKLHYDTAVGSVQVRLTTKWRQFTIDLRRRDLSRIKSGFYWSASARGEGFTFYLDDVRYE